MIRKKQYLTILISCVVAAVSISANAQSGKTSKSSKYTIGAWYHGNWFFDAFMAERLQAYKNAALPSFQKTADVWNGVRNVALNDQFYAEAIAQMNSQANYNLSHKPLLGFYDLSDQRVIDKQIEMASSRGLSFFGFYNYYQTTGYAGYTSRVVSRFKSSSKKHLLKYMVNLYGPSSISVSMESFTNTFTRAILNQLAVSEGSSVLDPSYLTNDKGQPIISLSPGAFFGEMTDADINSVVKSLRQSIVSRFGTTPIILLVSDIELNNGTVKRLMNNGALLYDGYIGFQHLMPTGDIAGTDYASRPMSNPINTNKDLINSIPDYVPQKYNIPSISVGFDQRPWNPQATLYFKNTSPDAFSHFLGEYKKYIDSTSITSNMLMCYAWNEWGESSALEPSEGYQYQYLDAIKNTFFPELDINNPDLTKFSTTYDLWKNSKKWGKFAALNNYGDDPDNDGLQNIFEYAFDLNPLVADTYKKPKELPYYNSQNVELKYTRDYRKNDLIYFVETSADIVNEPDRRSWGIFDDTDWDHENDPNWAVHVTTKGTIETRSLSPLLKHRNANDLKIKRLRLGISILKQDRAINEPIERFFFPPENSQGN